MRMVFALGDESEGVNIIPGGVSGLVDGEHFSDQTSMWLSNETLPVWLGAEQLGAHGVLRETYTPGSAPGVP